MPPTLGSLGLVAPVLAGLWLEHMGQILEELHGYASFFLGGGAGQTVAAATVLANWG